MSYIDGFVIPVPAGNREAYLAMSKQMTATFKRLGATRVVECWGSDVPDGKVTDYKMAVKAEDGENVVFSWIEWPDKAARDKGWESLMKDERMKGPEDNPMAGARMIYGGYSVILDQSA